MTRGTLQTLWRVVKLPGNELRKLIEDVDITALRNDDEWREFVWSGVSLHWKVLGLEITNLNRILVAAIAVGRYRNALEIIRNVTASPIDQNNGLFMLGKADEDKLIRLFVSWRQELARRIGERALTIEPRLVDKLPTLTHQQTLNIWTRCVNLLSSKAYSDRWQDSRLILDALYKEWKQRRWHWNEAFFEWPSVDAPGGDGTLRGDWLQTGLLAYMGYRVGRTQGLPVEIRRGILREIFGGGIPPIFPDLYISEWGEANSPARLKKLAECIASFV